MEITEGVHKVDGVNANCYILVGPELVLVDTGLPRNAKKILDYIQDTLKRNPEDVKTIVLTHHHIDHTGNLYEIKKATNAEVAAHAQDAEYIAGRKTQQTPKKINLMFKIMRLSMKNKPVQPDILLKDKDAIAGYTVIHTPGHTPGSICLHNPETKVILVGDILRFVGGKIEGPPPHFTPDMALAKKSTAKILNLDFDIMLSGHGDPLKPNAADKIRQFYSSWK